MALYVMSVGGSLIFPDEIDVEFLKKFKEFILNRVEKGDRFILIAGGGKICRKYQQALKSVVKDISDEDNDMMGINTTWMNAYLLKSVFGDLVNNEVIKNPTEQEVDFGEGSEEGVLVGGGWKPGCSTDFDAVLIAKRFHADTIINLSNIDYVYDKDPNKFDDAEIIKEIDWSEFQKLVGDKWDPGLNAPFDPIASKECAKLGLRVAILNGKNLKNIGKFMDGEEFVGTRIG